ncbi:MAG: hypothetical protein A2Y00_05550 [Omnitrophica WOR_2 bacterium GWF2_43_52]|nr:MAG: hypothetical protein A2062_00200 [Omnitrophica WOR_2 bacterium GWA2_44_7]OGX20565.1 MAG: hypothetical protein A2Y00_05550 [Omnitrophica WOR_2 bacterium GWF2_43_52]HAH21619.1 hypothetical protein [Candidatus Omnitrophota bacterium]HBG64212.1 hypothetical protein [Candidatus Omnitrophota bacterium]
MDDLICAKCGKPISRDMAYVVVKGSIVLSEPKKRPMVFTCIEQAYNYAQSLVVHDVCWIAILKEHGVELYDMNEVAKKYTLTGTSKKETQDGLGQDKT